MTKAVLFDLDDTLFDHQGCARDALAAVRDDHACFGAIPFADFERAHARHLEALHAEVMLGRVPLDDARRERFRRLFEGAGVTPGDDLVELAAATYRDRYRVARRAVPGGTALLALVKARARVGVISNNLLAEQRDKMTVCGLDVFVDALVVSEDAGVAKPDAGIFRLAIDRLGCRADEAVMVGDSWSADIAGARAAGIRAIWFNPSGEAPPEDDPSVAELRAFEPAAAALRMIFDANRD